jgi:hypothetical protein
MSYIHFCQFKTALLYQSKAASSRMIRKHSTSTLDHGVPGSFWVKMKTERNTTNHLQQQPSVKQNGWH